VKNKHPFRSEAFKNGRKAVKSAYSEFFEEYRTICPTEFLGLLGFLEDLYYDYTAIEAAIFAFGRETAHASASERARATKSATEKVIQDQHEIDQLMKTKNDAFFNQVQEKVKLGDKNSKEQTALNHFIELHRLWRIQDPEKEMGDHKVLWSKWKEDRLPTLLKTHGLSMGTLENFLKQVFELNIRILNQVEYKHDERCVASRFSSFLERTITKYALYLVQLHLVKPMQLQSLRKNYTAQYNTTCRLCGRRLKKTRTGLDRNGANAYNAEYFFLSENICKKKDAEKEPGTEFCEF